MISIFEIREELDSFREKLISEVIQAVETGKKRRAELEMGDFMSIAEAARYFGKSRATLNTWINKGHIQSIKKGNQRLLLRSAAQQLKSERLERYERLI